MKKGWIYINTHLETREIVFKLEKYYKINWIVDIRKLKI